MVMEREFVVVFLEFQLCEFALLVVGRDCVLDVL